MLIKSVVFVVLILAVVFLYVKYLEKNAVFFPVKENGFTPKSVNLEFEDVYFKSSDGLTINGWFIPSDKAKYTILFFHGNAGNLNGRIERINLLSKLNENLFIIDYRGYGKSEGVPFEQGVYKDARAAYDYLLNERKIKPERILIYGASMGGAVAVDLASRVKTAGVILEGTFSRGKDMAQKLYPYVPFYIFSNIFDSLSKIKKVHVPKLFIHSAQDEIVPLQLGKKLYDSASWPKQFVQIQGNHNDAFLNSSGEYLTTLKKFIDSIDDETVKLQ